MTSSAFRAFVFDLDGTLIDTASELVAVYHRMCVELGSGEKPFDDARKLISYGSGRLVTEATGIEEGDPRWEPYRQTYLDWYEEILGTSATPYEGLVDTVKAIDEAGGSWGVVTNKFRRFAEPLMSAMPFTPPAGTLVTPCDVKRAKPDPEAILLAAEQLSVSAEQMVYVGDHLRDIQAGNAAGCFTVAVGYGYIEDHDDPRTWGANLYVKTPSDLCTWIRNQIECP